MSEPSSLESAVYGTLAKIMTGPHGRALSRRSPADLLVVFSCADPEVGRAAAKMHAEGYVHRVVFSGGVGKDSGGLALIGITEASFLASVAIAEGLPAAAITLEEESTNGAENAAFALRLAAKLGILPPGTRLASLAPATRSRRLYEELRYQADRGSYEVDVVTGLSSGVADPASPAVREELIRELRGLHTMDRGETPRIFRQDDFQPGGAYWNLVERFRP
jgi:hypothetical protein